METQTRVSYQWEHLLSYVDRAMIVCLYREGFAILNIAKTFKVSSTTIQYHLESAGAYCKGREVTQRNRKIDEAVLNSTRQLGVITIHKTMTPQILTIHQRMIREDIADRQYEQYKPTMYEQIVRKQRAIRAKMQRTDYADSPAKWHDQPFVAAYSFDL